MLVFRSQSFAAFLPAGWPVVPASLVAAAAILLLLGIVTILYWGFVPIFREWRRVQEALARHLSKPHAEIGGFQRASLFRWFAHLFGITAGIVAAAVLLLGLGSLSGWVLPALYCAMGVWGLAWPKIRMDRITGALYLILSVVFASPRQIQLFWIALVLPAGLVAFALGTQRKKTSESSPESNSVRGAYLQGNYVLAIERAGRMTDSTLLDKHRELSAMALARYRRRDFGGAEAVVRKMLAGKSDGARACEISLILARVQIEKREYRAAADTLDAASELHAANPLIPWVRTLLFLREGTDPARALESAREAGEAMARHAWSASILAWALAANGRYAEARQALATHGDASNVPKPEIAEASYYAGRALLCCEDSAGAAAFFRLAVEAEPDGLFGYLAHCLEALEDSPAYTSHPPSAS